MVQTINGWKQIGDYCFVKNEKGKVYTVVQIIGHLYDHMYYETYYNVDLTEITEEFFSSDGSFKEYLSKSTNDEKAVYAAILGMTYDESCNGADDEEITSFLREDGIIDTKETFTLV